MDDLQKRKMQNALIMGVKFVNEMFEKQISLYAAISVAQDQMGMPSISAEDAERMARSVQVPILRQILDLAKVAFEGEDGGQLSLLTKTFEETIAKHNQETH